MLNGARPRLGPDTSLMSKSSEKSRRSRRTVLVLPGHIEAGPIRCSSFRNRPIRACRRGRQLRSTRPDLHPASPRSVLGLSGAPNAGMMSDSWRGEARRAKCAMHRAIRNARRQAWRRGSRHMQDVFRPMGREQGRTCYSCCVKAM